MSNGTTRATACVQGAGGVTPSGAQLGPCDADNDALPYGASAFTAPGPLGPFTPAPNFINCPNGETFFSADGSVVVACPTGAARASFLSVSSAPSLAAALAGNWTHLPLTISLAGSNATGPSVPEFHWEDQTIWRDARGYFHTLMHAFRGQNTTLPAPGCTNEGGSSPFLPMNCTSLGGHAFSIDAAHWWVSADAAYTALVDFEDGTSAQFRARERPHVILDEAGELAFFLSAVGDPGKGGNTGVAGADHSFTLIQPVVT